MSQLDMKLEMDRRKSTTARMLEAFKLKGELTTNDLLRFGNGCSSRLHTLRKEGHIITAIYVKPGQYRYVYKGHRDDQADDWDAIRSQASESA